MPKTAVLVIDMQKDFTRPEGKFYYPETTGEMMKTFPEKINKMRDLGALIVIVCGILTAADGKDLFSKSKA